MKKDVGIGGSACTATWALPPISYWTLHRK